jgi:hypothetical protein
MPPIRMTCPERWNPASGRVRLIPTQKNASGGRVPPGKTAWPSAFSLVEVIIAVGLFATSVTVVIALLPALTRHGAITQDTLAAQRLPDALKVELMRLAASGGFDALAGQAPVMSTTLGSGLALVATRDASRVHSRDYLPPAADLIPDGEQYFLIECWRFPDEPLRFDPAKHSLALAVRVSWPYRLPGSTAPTAEETRTRVVFTVSITR